MADLQQTVYPHKWSPVSRRTAKVCLSETDVLPLLVPRNSTSDSNVRDSLLQCITDVSRGSGGVTISIQDVAEACTKQKYGKAVGLDGIAMEPFIYGGHRLHHMFIKCGYVPHSFMKSVIIPLVKCKTGSLSDINNYWATAISTAVSKLFESVLSVCIKIYETCKHMATGL